VYAEFNNWNGSKSINTNKMEEWGGKENFMEIYKGFYRDMFADPFMNVLFDMTHSDTNVPPEEHGKRLGLFFLCHFGSD
jgi:hypothetical protein